MTTEEAIKRLNKIKAIYKGMDNKSDVKALDMAIKALEQEPTTKENLVVEDCISRNAIIETLNEMDRYIADELTLCDSNNKFPKNEVFIVDDVYEQIAEQLPPVTPKSKTDVLDKIRAEIKGMTPTYHNADWSITDLVPISEVLKIVDRYKAESEEEE